MDALKHFGYRLAGSTLYFVRVDGSGLIAPSDGVPFCTVCSRLAMEAGIGYFALWTSLGLKTWTTSEYDRLSYSYFDV
jgi:hypothetical protein